ncbi:uncharacterized protein M6G45_009112 isoform 6-T6 [Spheniscus humboldti]
MTLFFVSPFCFQCPSLAQRPVPTEHLAGSSAAQTTVLLCLASVVPHLRHREDSLQVLPWDFPGPFSAVLAFCTSMELDAQEQRIYQLQTKQRERQAELEQKCSRIQQLSQDLEASHQLQEEAQKQTQETKTQLAVAAMEMVAVME